ncbi:MAG TPA: ATP-binding cassette domain-containing protein [Terriglobia bacterium]|nr:ATP-binding cassette domain-containing protein [Terriglobia bacterium]
MIPLEITGMTKIFDTPAGPFVALKDVSVRFKDGEFVCILGHSGCGKSTVLSIVAGLQRATYGGVVIDGKQVDEPGTDRGVVFQSPCLLPWLTAGENVELAIGQAFPSYTTARKRQEAGKYLDLVGVGAAYRQRPAELSLGTQQCVALARAFSTNPRFLLLDEPFSMLDSLTRLDIQDILLHTWERSRKLVVMVTHDVDEAIYLSDRIVLMTDGPEARVGEIVEIPFSRPRNRIDVLEHPEYYATRARILDFLENHAKQLAGAAARTV